MTAAAPSSRAGAGWTVWALLFLGAFIIALTPVADGDIFWHLAAGREIVSRHTWLRTDPFTLSAGGRAWVDVHWLFQLGVFAVDRAGGLVGIVVVKALVVASGAVLLARTVERSQGRLGLVMCAVGLLATMFLARHLLLARPVIVTLVMLAAFVAVLESQDRGGTGRRLFLLPLLQVVWANCQGLAVLGPIVVFAYLADVWVLKTDDTDHAPGVAPANLVWSRARTLAVILFLCALALLVTPYGWRGLTLPGGLFMRVVPGAENIFSAQVAENVPPWILDRIAPVETTHLTWVLGLIALCLGFGRHALPASRLLLLGALTALALMANRNVLLLYWLAPPLISLTAAPRLRGWWARATVARAGRPGLPRGGWALATLVLCGEVAVASFAARREGDVRAPVAFHFPVESAKILRRMGASGPIFAPDHQGGYLEWAVPGLRPYIDTRLVLHTAEEYAAYLGAVEDPAKFDALADAWRIRYVVLTTSYPDRYLGLARHLASSLVWRLVFTDGSEMLFTRATAPAPANGAEAVALSSRNTTNAILRDLAGRFRDTPALHEAARLNLARLLVVCGETREAQSVLSTLNSRAAAQMRARAYFAAGEPAAAESLAWTLVESDQRDVRSLALLAQVAIVRGQPDVGADWLRRALSIDPFDAESNAVLEKLEQAQSARGTDP